MKLLASALALSAALGLPAHAQSNLQWRSTTCQIEENGEIIATNKCHAGFAYDTAIRAIKYWDNDHWTYDQVGNPGVSFSATRECMSINYTNGQHQFVCTTSTPEQLGIIGD
jgi:hypothetical protein